MLVTIIFILFLAMLAWRRGASLWEWLCKRLASSVGAALVAFVGVFAASCVSIYSQDLVTQGRPYVASLLNGYVLPKNWEIILTLCLIGVAVVLIGIREIGLGAVVKTREKELENRISTLPPQDFLVLYGQGLREIGEIRRGTKIKYSKGELELDALEKAVRVVMKHVLGMAKLWDGISTTDENMLYRSNIMMVVHPEMMDGVKQDLASYETLVMKSPFFLYGDNFLSRLENSTGLLMIENNSFTVTSASEGAEPDKQVKPLCLPFAMPTTHRQPNLPGAPEAFVSKTAKYVHNTVVEMHQWLDVLRHKEYRFDKKFDEGVRNYYSEASHAQSILSIPINFEDRTMAVINIYRNKESIFKGEDRAQQFVALMNPVCYHLGKMLSLASRIA